jgi:hypothetical protein
MMTHQDGKKKSREKLAWKPPKPLTNCENDLNNVTHFFSFLFGFEERKKRDKNESLVLREEIRNVRRGRR